MIGPAGELDGRCAWCGWKLPQHDPTCYVPGFLERLAVGRAVAAARAAAADAPLTPQNDTSREQFAAAQRAGTTVGHEWGRQSAESARQTTI